jgi:hypothetical protein
MVFTQDNPNSSTLMMILKMSAVIFSDVDRFSFSYDFYSAVFVDTSPMIPFQRFLIKFTLSLVFCSSLSVLFLNSFFEINQPFLQHPIIFYFNFVFKFILPRK